MMRWIWWGAGALLGAIWMHRVADAALGMRKVPVLTDPDWDDGPERQWARVSIIVPARNEQKHIEQSLRSALALHYPDLQVIAIDDRSTDATGKIMDRLAAEDTSGRLQVIHISELPPQWLGKPHAMWRAAQQATGEWLLFTDADVEFRRDAVTRAMRYAARSGADHAVVFPTYTNWSFSKKIMLSGFNILFVFGHRPWKTNDPEARDHTGVGAFNLIRRSVYEQVGTFQALRMEVIEDMRLGKLVKDAGFAQRAAFGNGIIQLSWGEGAIGIIQNLTKNFFALMHYSVPRALGGLFLLCFLNLLPFVGFWFAPGMAKIPFAIALFGVLCMYVGMSWYSEIEPWYFVFHPISTGLLVYTMLRSISHTLWNGGVVWRGTKYSLEDLREGIVKG